MLLPPGRTALLFRRHMQAGTEGEVAAARAQTSSSHHAEEIRLQELVPYFHSATCFVVKKDIHS